MGISDIDESEEADTNPEQTPVQLALEAEEPSTVAYVKRAVHRHSTSCPAQRSVRRWRLWIAAAFGAAMVVQVVWLLVGRAIIRETVRDVVREELAGRTVSHSRPTTIGIISTASAADVSPQPR